MMAKFKTVIEKKREEAKNYAITLVIFVFVILFYLIENLLNFLPWLLRAVITAITAAMTYMILIGVNNYGQIHE